MNALRASAIARAIHEGEESARRTAAPLVAKVDELLAAVDRHGRQIADLRSRVSRLDVSSFAQLLDPPPRECRECGAAIETEKRTMQ
ncbi:MAG TPA: hypothetical protein VKR31_16480 [Rhizomicrobium sp.]|nr:hypothetical protein [Rhizomicrobium sp.]